MSDALIRQGKNWPELFVCQVKIKQKTVTEQANELKTAVNGSASFDEFCRALRRHKQREYLRIGARDLDPSATMEETVRELTALAEASLEAAYSFCRVKKRGHSAFWTRPESKAAAFVLARIYQVIF